jgi:hypothetical protein
MKKYRVENQNNHGTGYQRVRVYPMPVAADGYWPAVTDVPCPICETGTVRWAEAGYVPGYRVCDHCHRHYRAQGNSAAPSLARLERTARYPAR